jgi:flagellar P-ring protein precursor FlgI
VVKFIFTLLALSLSGQSYSDRIKDLAIIEGVRDMPVIGYGLVVGLPGTGDGNISHTQTSMKKMLDTMGIKTNLGEKIKSKNVASVMISGSIAPFSRIGQRFDLVVTSIGDAKSIKDGTLLLSTLKGADGSVYAIASGQILAGGLAGNEVDNSFLSKNKIASGMVLGGGSVEKKWMIPLGGEGYTRYLVKTPDFTTSKIIADEINRQLGEGTAISENSTSIRIKSPKDPSQISPYISLLENITVTPASVAAKIIINSNTGTVVATENIIISEALVSHGSLVVQITKEGLGGVAEGQAIGDEEEDGRAFKFSSGIGINELISNINRIGIGPSDLVAILQSLKRAGALHADLIIL